MGNDDGTMGFEAPQKEASKTRAALERAEADLARAREESSVPSLATAKEEMEIARIWMQLELVEGGEGRRD